MGGRAHELDAGCGHASRLLPGSHGAGRCPLPVGLGFTSRGIGMSSSGFKYTVVIPHYNSAGKLARLVASIPQRMDIQIVVVDDLSESAEADAVRSNEALIERAQVLFPRRKLTAGGARNVGLGEAKGTWILFADADDFFEPGAFDVLDREISESKGAFDVFYFKVQGFREAGMEPSDRGLRWNRILDRYGRFSRFDHVVPWAKLVRHQLIKDHGITFEEVRYSNDLMYSARLAFASDAVRIIDAVLYNLEEGDGGLTSHKSQEDSFLRREVQLRHETLLFERLPEEFVAEHRYVFYRKYLRDSIKFGTGRLRELRNQYEKAAGISPFNLFRIRYFVFSCLTRLGLPKKWMGSGPGAPYWARD
ncbi:MAG: glycosyltransferase family 2 protein [Pseudomonas sp.]|nr:MAG: glycosyltransferase family 2 protein [Pseudomonas sp.]